MKNCKVGLITDGKGNILSRYGNVSFALFNFQLIKAIHIELKIDLPKIKYIGKNE